MKRIKLLPENLINQIAAGEVIERPSSIVKELLENSIDAGATKIEIEVFNNCRNIRVADNGYGIHKDDAILAFSRHATSKLTTKKDLWSISTLGFRGEALASIISVAKVVCLTRTSDDLTGIRIECENSKITSAETGCAIGTVMEIKDLFYNVPARMKFLKKNQTELANIAEIVQGIAISYPGISFHLIHKDNTTLKTSGSKDLAVTISEIYSKELIKELIEVYKEDTEFNLKVKGFTSSPDFTKSNKKAIYLSINGRIIKCPILFKAIDNAYKDTIPAGRFPFVVLDLTMDAQEIDVNVHPSKKEVRYSNPNQIFNFVQSSIKFAFEFNGQSYFLQKPVAEEIFQDFENLNNLSEPVVFSKNSQPQELSKEKIKNSIEFYSPPPVQTKIQFSPSENKIIIDKPKIVGQLFNTYILVENSQELNIIDQHILHERIIYEKLKLTRDFASQLLLISDVIELEPSQLSLLEENKEILSKFGYEFDKAGNKGIIFKQIPQILVNKEPEKIINEILEALEGSLEHIENKILITTACHAAVKAGERLSVWQMEELIIEWQNYNCPKTCPHGRKIVHSLPSKEIANYLGRVEINME
ncbi:MAG: DNA mismatch repair endonuclease MutL [bacterium]